MAGKELEGILEKIYEHVVQYMDAHWERIEDIFFPSEDHD
jgi:hypothetical protein